MTTDWEIEPDEQLQVAKVCGADVELGNFIIGAPADRSTPAHAATALLQQIDGVPSRVPLDAGFCGDSLNLIAGDPQDQGRKFLATNGGCVYIDLNHLEICLPEVLSAWDHLACWHAMLRVARDAQQQANAALADGKIQVLINNSDGLGASYGSHLNFLMTRRAWDHMFGRKLHQLLFLAAYQASSIVFTGQGKVGSENGAPDVAFQLSQRADFIETLAGPQTTFRRPLVNSRDESLCSPATTPELARLHVICYDSTLSHVAHLLKIGVLQIVLTMIEAERVNPALILDEPVGAMRRWSHDPALEHRERLATGAAVTAVEHQRLFIDEARRFIESGGCDGIVPRAAEILNLWDDTVARLERGDWDALVGRLDWVLKLSLLDTVLGRRPDLGWDSAEIKHLDHLFASLDPDEGLFWAYERDGLVEQKVSNADIERFLEQPPRDTRAWERTMLLRQAGDRITEVNWDYVRIRMAASRWGFSQRIDLPDPRRSNDYETAQLVS